MTGYVTDWRRPIAGGPSLAMVGTPAGLSFRFRKCRSNQTDTAQGRCHPLAPNRPGSASRALDRRAADTAPCAPQPRGGHAARGAKHQIQPAAPFETTGEGRVERFAGRWIEKRRQGHSGQFPAKKPSDRSACHPQSGMCAPQSIRQKRVFQCVLNGTGINGGPMRHPTANCQPMPICLQNPQRPRSMVPQRFLRHRPTVHHVSSVLLHHGKR